MVIHVFSPLRPDLLQEKYYGLHPYLYCAANPIRNIDPSGKDIYRLNRDASIDLIQNTTDTYDALYNSDNSNSITVAKGILNSAQTSEITAKSSNNFESRNNVTVLSSNSSLDDLYDFMIDNVDVEVSHLKTSSNLNQNKDFIGTAHLDYSDSSPLFMTDMAQGEVLTVNRMSHNHPGNMSSPSQGDINVALKLEAINPSVELRIYTTLPTTQYTSYNSSSTPGLLKDVEITATYEKPSYFHKLDDLSPKLNETILHNKIRK